MSRTPQPRAGTPLTVTQLRILSLLAEGLTRAEIGDELHVAETTVREHTRRIRSALGARNAAHSVALAIRTRQLPAAPGTEADPVAEIDDARLRDALNSSLVARAITTAYQATDPPPTRRKATA